MASFNATLNAFAIFVEIEARFARVAFWRQPEVETIRVQELLHGLFDQAGPAFWIQNIGRDTSDTFFVAIVTRTVRFDR